MDGNFHAEESRGHHLCFHIQIRAVLVYLASDKLNLLQVISMELMIVPRKIPFRRHVIGCVIIGLATPKAILLEYHFVAFCHERSSCCYILALSLIASNFVTFG